MKLKLMMLATIFATTKHSSSFSGREKFDLKAVYAVIDNCATATVLNDKGLFTDNFREVTGIGIITVGGDD